ncbi:hypothetical protein DFS34DRAFT_16208 [Phlyctochytrium arcticum]|nr:hypothetical protein DFS34DRAFT_16208 [Phlyctochytrium arcticum]
MNWCWRADAEPFIMTLGFTQMKSVSLLMSFVCSMSGSGTGFPDNTQLLSPQIWNNIAKTRLIDKARNWTDLKLCSTYKTLPIPQIMMMLKMTYLLLRHLRLQSTPLSWKILLNPRHLVADNDVEVAHETAEDKAAEADPHQHAHHPACRL